MRLNRLPSFQVLSIYLFSQYVETWVKVKRFVVCLKIQEKGLRIAWQYKKYFGENQQNFDAHRGKSD